MAEGNVWGQSGHVLDEAGEWVVEEGREGGFRRLVMREVWMAFVGSTFPRRGGPCDGTLREDLSVWRVLGPG